jgi:hypothetical protein
VLLALEATLAQFAMGYSGAARAAPIREPAVVAPDVTFTISLDTIDDVRRLDERPEIADVIIAARAYSASPIFLAAYVTAADVRAYRADVTAVTVADQLVIEVGGYLASRGVEADRISGKGMGIDSAIGRAVVVSFGTTEPPSERDPGVLQVDREGLPPPVTLGMDSSPRGL